MTTLHQLHEGISEAWDSLVERWPHEAIERQLAHMERNKVSAAYKYAEHLPV